MRCGASGVSLHLQQGHHAAVVARQQANVSSRFSSWDQLAQTFLAAPDLSLLVSGVDTVSANDVAQ